MAKRPPSRSRDERKTKAELLKELAALRRRVDQLEKGAGPAALPRVDHHYRALFKKAKAVMLLIEPSSGAIVDVNAAAAKFYGYSQKRMKQLRINDLNTTDPLEVAREMDRAAAQKRSHFYFRHRLASGREVDVEVHSGPIEVDGRTLLFSVVHDISKRREAERSLEGRLSLLQTLVKTLPAPIFERDLSLRYVDCNAAFEGFLGLPREAIIGKVATSVAPRETARAQREANRRLLAEGGTQHYEIDVPNPDAGMRRVAVHKAVYRYADGQPAGIVGMMLDVTERTQIEAALRRSEELFRRVFTDGPLGFGLVDFDGRFSMVNEALCDMLGYTSAELVGRSPSEITHAEDIERSRDLIGMLFRGEIPSYQLEKRYLKKSGETVWVQLTGSVVMNDAGAPVRMVGMVVDITARKQTEAALRDSEKRFDLAVRASRDAIFDWNMATDDFYVSPTIRGFGGNEDWPEQMNADMAMERIHPDDREAFADNLRAHLRGQTEHIDCEFRANTSDGIEHWRAFRGVAQRDASGRAYRMTGSFSDITDRKRAEEALRESKERYQLAVEGARDAIWDWNVVTGEVYHAEMLYSFPGMAGFTDRQKRDYLTEMVIPEDRAGLRDKLVEHFKGNTEYLQHEHRIMGNDGRITWHEVRGKAVRDATGRVVRVAGSLADISERKQSEAALRDSEQRYQLAIEGARDAIWDWNIETGDVYISDVIRSFRGMARLDEADKPRYLEKLVMPEDRPEMRRKLVGHLKGETGHLEHEYRVMTSEGGVTWHQIRGVAVRDATGRAVRLAGSIADISERREAEDRLRQSQKLEAIGQLTGGVAHDFNNLLAVILGNSEMILEALKSRDPDLANQAESVVRAATSGSDLTRHLLAYSRQQPLEPKVVGLDKIVEGMTDMLRRSIGETIEIETVIAPSLWACSVDPGQVENALLNLAVNARDAMPDGGALRIELSNLHLSRGQIPAGSDLTAGRYVVLGVTDTGCGMSAEIIKRATEPYFTTKGVGKGTGLGLSMVFGFARQSGGHLTIDSTVDKGTSVRLYLPRAEAEAAAKPKSTDEEKLEGAGRIVLVVEDDPDVRDLTVTQLGRLGYETIEAADGATALGTLKNGDEVDLLLTDVVLPGGVSGPDLAKWAAYESPELRVVFMSGYTDHAMIHDGRLDPGILLLNKPFRLRDLAGKLREAFGESAA